MTIALAACTQAASPTLQTSERPTVEPPAAASAEDAPDPAACTDLEEHPIAAAIAEDFEADYDDVIGWFCAGHSFEDILLALQTERLAPMNVPALLAERDQGKSWHRIWKDLGITTP